MAIGALQRNAPGGTDERRSVERRVWIKAAAAARLGDAPRRGNRRAALRRADAPARRIHRGRRPGRSATATSTSACCGRRSAIESLEARPETAFGTRRRRARVRDRLVVAAGAARRRDARHPRRLVRDARPLGGRPRPARAGVDRRSSPKRTSGRSRSAPSPRRRRRPVRLRDRPSPPIRRPRPDSVPFAGLRRHAAGASSAGSSSSSRSGSCRT